MRLRSVIVGLGMVSAVGLLVSCSSVKKEIGLGRNSPDEFAVVTRAPLSMPPEYDLTPPKSGDEANAEAVSSAQKQAKSLVFKTDVNIASSNTSPAEAVLLNKAGAGQADESIRLTVDREAGQVDVKDPYLGRRLLGLGNPDAEKGEALNPTEEMQRLNDAEHTETAQPETEQAEPSAE